MIYKTGDLYLIEIKKYEDYCQMSHRIDINIVGLGLSSYII